MTKGSDQPEAGDSLNWRLISMFVIAERLPLERKAK